MINRWCKKKTARARHANKGKHVSGKWRELGTGGGDGSSACAIRRQRRDRRPCPGRSEESCARVGAPRSVCSDGRNRGIECAKCCKNRTGLVREPQRGGQLRGNRIRRACPGKGRSTLLESVPEGNPGESDWDVQRPSPRCRGHRGSAAAGRRRAGSDRQYSVGGRF